MQMLLTWLEYFNIQKYLPKVLKNPSSTNIIKYRINFQTFKKQKYYFVNQLNNFEWLNNKNSSKIFSYGYLAQRYKNKKIAWKIHL